MEKKIRSLNEILSVLDRSKKIILAHGCFDLVHPGHLRHLTYAKSKADILIVSLTADKYITKGVYRPTIPEQLRAESLAALSCVDYVLITDAPDALDVIKQLKPNYFAKGYEYSDEHHPATLEEMKALDAHSGEIIFTPGDMIYSSTKLLNMRQPKLHIEKLLSLMKRFDITFDGIRLAIAQFKNFKAHVVGDNIIDTYTRTSLIGSNAKTPTFSVLYQGHEDYVGGAAIVAEHLRIAGAEVIFTSGDRVTKKNAIICGDTRLLKIDTVDNTPLPPKEITSIVKSISETKADCVVFSDFRHGIFHKGSIPVLTAAIPDGVFKVADSQVASRWGNITEFKGFDLITPNEKEARFAMADQDSNIGRLISDTKEAAQCKNILMKLGPRGAFFLQDDSPYSLDSFAHCVKDAVGAGDALLAYATLTMLATKSLPMACIIGSTAAACECEIDGNIPVKPEDVLRKLAQYE